MQDQTAQTIAHALGESLYKTRYTAPKAAAQDALSGRTHYADESTLRYFHSRILACSAHHAGTFLRVVETVALDHQNTQRGYRVVLFDLTGETVHRPSLDECHKTKGAAYRAFEAWFATFNPIKHYRALLTERAERTARQAAEMAAVAQNLED